MDKKEKTAVALTAAGLTGLGLYLYLKSKKVSAISTTIPTTSTLTPIITKTYTPTPTPTPTLTSSPTYSYGQIIGPITSSTTMTINTPHVLVVAVGGGGAGGGTGCGTEQGGNGGNTVVTNGSQTITAGGGQGGWSGNYCGSGGTCVGCALGPGGDGGTGSVENVQYYQILNGNAGTAGIGLYTPYCGTSVLIGLKGGNGGALPSGYQQAIQQVLQEAGINYSVSLTIPSTPCQPSENHFIYPTAYINGTPATGYGAGGCGNGGHTYNASGGGGSGAIVVALMNGGTFNITVGQGGQPAPNLISCPSNSGPLCSVGMPGVVYLVPLP
ncbi:MAG: hypothetical protein QW046_06355 [Candidatus Micrarchaeaceae archaeon]